MKKRIIIKKKQIQIKENKRRGINMCKKITELSGKNAYDLLNLFGQTNSVPVDVAKICYDLGIRVQSMDFTEIEKVINKANDENGKDTIGYILGIVLVLNNDLAILYRDMDTLNRRRFTIAHELAHCCLHMDPTEEIHIEFRTDEQSDNPRERDANIFAGELLIPETSLKNVISKIYNNQIDIPSLSQLFAVSENVMKERLNYLKIS